MTERAAAPVLSQLPRYHVWVLEGSKWEKKRAKERLEEVNNYGEYG
jgi:hypothetical protein